MKNPFPTLGTSIAAAVGAGIASAILFSLVNQVTVVAIALAYLSPLPIMIAVLGFGRIPGVIATAVAALTVFGIAIIQQPHEGRGAILDAAALAGLTFVLSLGLPALWLSFLAALSRPKGSSSWSITVGAGRSFARDYCPLERLLTYGVAISATVAVAGTLYVSFRHGGFAASLDLAEGAVAPALEGLIGDLALPRGIDAHSIAQLIVLATPPAVAASTLLMLTLNLWLAGRVAEVSGRLPRPWPDIPHELGLPRTYALVFVAAAAGASFIGGVAALISAIVAAALGMGFALQGLAVIHDLSRGLRFRTLLLTLVYVSLALLMPWPLVPVAVLGLLDSAFSLRNRRQNKISPKP